MKFFLIVLFLFVLNKPFVKAEDFKKDFNKFEKKIFKSLDTNKNILFEQPWHVMNHFGHSYSEGINEFPKDFERSIFWFEKASELGLPLATYNLASAYYSGTIGVEQNFDKAHSLFILAFEQRFVEYNTRFFISAVSLEKDLDEILPNPTEKFANLKNLFISALDLPSQTRYKRLKNLSKLNDQDASIEKFLFTGEVTCDGRGTINIKNDYYENFKIKVLAKTEDTMIIKKIYDVDLLVSGFSSPDEELLSLEYSKNNNNTIEWFDYVDEKWFGKNQNYFTYNKLYLTDNQQLKLYTQPYFIKADKEFNLKMNEKFKIKSEEKLANFGSQKHLELEEEFYYELYNTYPNLMKDTNNGASLTEEYVCEI